MRFRAEITQTGGTTTGIIVPPGLIESLGGGKRPAVKVTINKHAYRSTVGVMAGTYMLPVSAAVREAAKVAGGDEVEVMLELDTTPREVAQPKELLEALKKDSAARRVFESLSNSRKQRYTLPIQNAKAQETKDRNVQKAMAELRKLAKDA